MTNNEKMFLKLLSASIFDNKEQLEVTNNIDWKTIYEESFNQSVVSLIYESVLKLNNKPEMELMLDWEEESMVSVMRNSNIMFEHKALLGLMKENGIKCAILKGAAAAVNYPKPDLRSMGDIDILVKEEDFKKAKNLMNDNGYEEVIIFPQVSHEVGFRKNNVKFELHLNAPGVPDGSLGKIISEEIQKIPDSVVTATVGGIEFPKPETKYNGLILLLHVIHHLGSGIGFRQITDWAMFVSNELTDDVWQNELEPMLKKYRILNIAKVLTKMCCKYLGLPFEKCIWCAGADDRACDEFIEKIFEDGNFGRKSGARNNSATMLIGNSTQKDNGGFILFKVFYNLQNAGKNAWPLARENRFVSLFAWAYVPLRFIKRLFTGERSFKELTTILGSAKKRYPLIKKLKIFRE